MAVSTNHNFLFEIQTKQATSDREGKGCRGGETQERKTKENTTKINGRKTRRKEQKTNEEKRRKGMKENMIEK